MKLCKIFLLSSLFLASFQAFALEESDRLAIQNVIQSYTDSWNMHGGKGFADGYSENADFVNIFGMKLQGKEEIESRHIKIIQTFFKGSNLEILDTRLREVQPGLVVALVTWKLNGFRAPGSDVTKPGETREGVYTQVFVNTNNKWQITASQNTLIPN